MNEPIIESFVTKVTARVVEDQAEVVMRTVRHIGGEMFCDITIDRHKVIEALTDYVEKCRGYRKQSECENIGTVHPVDEFICSNCGIALEGWTKVVTDEDDGEQYNYEYAFKYCPNCGARVKGGGEE